MAGIMDLVMLGVVVVGGYLLYKEFKKGTFDEEPGGETGGVGDGGGGTGGGGTGGGGTGGGGGVVIPPIPPIPKPPVIKPPVVTIPPIPKPPVIRPPVVTIPRTPPTPKPPVVVVPKPPVIKPPVITVPRVTPPPTTIPKIPPISGGGGTGGGTPTSTRCSGSPDLPSNPSTRAQMCANCATGSRCTSICHCKQCPQCGGPTSAYTRRVSAYTNVGRRYNSYYISGFGGASFGGGRGIDF